MNTLEVIWAVRNTASRNKGTIDLFSHTAFAPLAPGTIIALERVLCNCGAGKGASFGSGQQKHDEAVAITDDVCSVFSRELSSHAHKQER